MELVALAMTEPVETGSFLGLNIGHPYIAAYIEEEFEVESME
jgi:hypothetical protein